jgi:hypothetical protein
LKTGVTETPTASFAGSESVGAGGTCACDTQGDIKKTDRMMIDIVTMRRRCVGSRSVVIAGVSWMVYHILRFEAISILVRVNLQYVIER